MTWLGWWIVAASAGPPILAEAWVFAEDPGALRRPGLVMAEGHVRRGEGLAWRVHLTDAALASLQDDGFDVELRRHDHRRGPPPPGYTDPEASVAELADLAASSERAGQIRAGYSVEGRPIDALWLGQPPESGSPALRVAGGIHGDEASSYEVAMETARTLLVRDGSDPAITELLDTSTVWVLPHLNPDGATDGQRYNARGVDLNRNHDYAWSEAEWSGGDAPFSEPETRALRTLTLWHPHPMASLSLHSGDVNIGYVWNFTRDDTPEEDHLRDLGERYAASCTRDGFYVTNGADWYITYGDTNDWSYGRYGGMDFTVELTFDKTPPASQIDTFVGDHLDSVLAFLTTPADLSGRVVDAETGRPIPAAVQLLDAEGAARSAPFFSDGVTGRFHRITSGAATTLEVAAPGYAPAQVSVGTEEIALQPAGRQAPTFSFATRAGETVDLDVAAEAALLTAPGLPTTTADISFGRLLVPETLPVGLWTVTVADTTWPRSLLVQSPTVPGVGLPEHGDGWLRLPVDDPSPGPRAWVVSGADRARHPVPVEASGDGLEIDLTALPDDRAHDVVILVGGQLLGVGHQDMTVDEGPARLVRRGSPACNSGGVSLSVSLWTLIVGILVRRQC